MATRIIQWLGSNGDVLLPLSEETYNDSNLISVKKGVYYKPVVQEILAIEAGNPMGLLLALTYPATP